MHKIRVFFGTSCIFLGWCIRENVPPHHVLHLQVLEVLQFEVELLWLTSSRAEWFLCGSSSETLPIDEARNLSARPRSHSCSTHKRLENNTAFSPDFFFTSWFGVGQIIIGLGNVVNSCIRSRSRCVQNVIHKLLHVSPPQVFQLVQMQSPCLVQVLHCHKLDHFDLQLPVKREQYVSLIFHSHSQFGCFCQCCNSSYTYSW